MKLNAARRGTRFLLASPQRLHAAVLSGFPNDQGLGQPRVLWRLDQSSRHDLRLFIVSPSEPDLTHLVEQAGWPTQATWGTHSYDGFLSRLGVGQQWAFRLRANPMHRGRDKEGHSKTFAHVTVAQQEKWFLDRTERLGVHTKGGSVEPSIRVTNRETRTFERKSAPSGHGRTVTIATAQFDGLLTVTDPELLRAALTQGIGRAKAYGCGLLTLAAPEK